MSRKAKLVITALVLAVIVGVIYFRILSRHMAGMARNQPSEEQARREVIEAPISTPTDVKVTAKIFWASPTAPNQLAPVDVDMPLSADPVLRAKQVLRALIAQAPSPQQATLPADAELIDFYILPDGTGIADFTDTISSHTPSGILSEQLVVNSIARTLEANVANLRRLKILIHGQESDTLAGHVDLTGFFDLHPPAPPASATTAPPSGSPAPAALTAPAAPGKLKP